MSRYRKVDPRFWKDEKIINLPAEEKLIVLYLFTGQSNRIGLSNFSPGEAAEDLALAPETFGKGFENVCKALEFGWDESFRVLYLPTWWKYNCPENPNVLKACLADLHEVPKTRLITTFSTNLQHLPETFHQTFQEALAKRSPQRMADQEQEQKHSRGKMAAVISMPAKARKSSSTEPDGRVKEFIDWFKISYEQRFEQPYHVSGGKEGSLVKQLLRTFELEELKRRAIKLFESEFYNAKDIGVFASQVNKLGPTTNGTKSVRRQMPA